MKGLIEFLVAIVLLVAIFVGYAIVTALPWAVLAGFVYLIGYWAGWWK